MYLICLLLYDLYYGPILGFGSTNENINFGKIDAKNDKKMYEK